MHFFLNKIGYLPEYGFIAAPDYNRLPFFEALRVTHRLTVANLLGRTKWLPNMADTQRIVCELPRLERHPLKLT